MAWKGVDDDSGLYFSINPTRTSDGWRAQENIPGVGSSDGPALAWFDGAFWLAWKGVDGDSELYFARNHDGKWSGQTKMPGIGIKCWPSLVVAETAGAFYRVVSTTARTFASRRCAKGRSRKWDDPQVVACAIASGGTSPIGSTHAPVPLAVDDALLAIWKGVSDDSAIYLSARDGDTWGGQVKWKGIGISRSPAAAMLGDVIVVAWKGVDDDHGLYFAKLTFAPGATASGIWFEWQA